MNKHCSSVDWQLYWEPVDKVSVIKKALDGMLKFIGLSSILASEPIHLSHNLLRYVDKPVVVEAGCGLGNLGLDLRKSLKDSNIIFIDICQEALSEIRVENGVRKIRADIRSIPLRAGCCDLCCNLGNH